jgi:hypothetical protein
MGFVPEEVELAQFLSGKGATNPLYPLRPELAESTLFHYRATDQRYVACSSWRCE